MRLTYGTVKGYSPADGVVYKYYTTLAGVMEKEDPDNYEFRVPAKVKALYEAHDFGQYANAEGKVPTCFLTTATLPAVIQEALCSMRKAALSVSLSTATGNQCRAT